MPIGDSISEPIPAVGTPGTSYAAQIVAFLTEIKSRLENKVALTSLLAGLFDLSNNPLSNAKYLGLYEQGAAPTTPVGSLQRYGNNLYYVSNAGAVRITNGANLDAVAVDGITGDYAAPAEFKYTVGDTTYAAYSDTGTTPDTWAYLAARALDIYGGAMSTVRARLTFTGGSSYTITVPTAAPGTKQLIQMDSSGVLTATNTVDEAVTLAANKNITLSGTGKVMYGEFSRMQLVKMEPGAWATSGTWSVSVNAAGGGEFSQAVGSTGAVGYAQINAIDSYHKFNSITIRGVLVSGSGNVTYDVMRLDSTTGLLSSILAATNTGAPDVTITNFSAASMTPGYSYYVKITMPGGGSYALFNMQVKYQPN